MKHSWHDKHVKQTIKSLFLSLYATLGTFLVFFVVFHISGAFYLSNLSEKSTYEFNKGIKQDIDYLKDQGDAVSKNNELITELVLHNRNNILPILEKERVKRGIGLMGLADGSGVIIGRTIKLGRYGDNVFLTAPAGRVVQSGKSVQSIELTGFKNQIFMTTARPVLQGDAMVGALFANYLLDDEYAKKFSRKYFSSGEEVIFYTKDYGVYGNSFSDKETRTLIDSYFNTGSNWIVNGFTDQTLVIKGHTYLVKNIVFSGLEKSPGGAIIFIPRKDVSGFANLITVVFTLCTFLFFSIRRHIRTRSEERGWRYYVLSIVAAVIVSVSTTFVYFLQNVGRIHIEHVPYTIYNSTLSLDPNSGVYDVGLDQRLSIIVNTGGEVINVAQIALKFDPTKVDFKSIEVGSSTCAYVVENNIDRIAGTASFICGILDSTSGQGLITVADIIVKPITPGTFTIAFDPVETKILASDGIGTNVLRIAQDSSYRADNFIFSHGTSTATSSEKSFVVFSISHSNESRWYNTKNAEFLWRGEPDATYRYAFDSVPDTIPTNNHIIKTNRIKIPIPGDGIFYFHLQLASGGPVVHYQIKSDKTPPVINTMQSSQENITVGDVVRFSFEADDVSSGVQRNYYVDLGGHLFLPVGKDLFVPFLDVGDQIVTLRVYDNAGNYTDYKKTINVRDKK